MLGTFSVRNLGFDLDTVLSSPDNKVTITGGNGMVNVEGFLVSDTTLSGNASWESDGGTMPIFETANNVLNTVSQSANFLGLGNRLSRLLGLGNHPMPQANFKTSLETTVTYRGTSLFPLSFQLCFPALSPECDVRDPVFQLLRCVYPVVLSNFVVLPPLLYSKGAFRQLSDPQLHDVSSALRIRIGRWFSTRQIFVCDSVRAAVSKEVIRSENPLYDGRPLMATVNVDFKSALEVGIDDIYEWFNGPEGA